jgi:Mrp family chromosome partitioning ATPase
MVRLLGRAEYVVVATPARVDLPTVRKTLRFLSDLPVPLAGVVENMRRADSPVVAELAAEFGLPLLASLPWDAALDEATGDPDRLSATDCAAALATAVETLEG